MTADIEANNHNHNQGEVRESEEVVVLAANNGGEQCCGPDDAVDVLSEINGNKDDVDGSYVFVTSHDDGDDLAGSDLNNANDNKPSIEEGLAVSQFQAEEKGNGDRETEALGSPADELNSRSSPEVDDDQMEGGGGGEIQELDIGAKNSDELGLAEGVEEDQESEIGVDNDDNSINNNINNNMPSDNTDQGVERAEESSNEIPKRGSGDDQEQEDPSTVSCLECKIKVDMVIEEIPICGDFGNGIPDGSKEVSVEESKQHNLEPQPTSNSLSDNILETEAANRPISEQQNRESLPADFAVESLSETAVVTEQNGSPAALDNEKPLCLSEESPVDGFKGDDDGDVLGEHGLKTSLGTGADEALEGEVATGPLLEQNGEDLPPGLAQESLSDAAVVTEPNGSSEIAQGLTSPLVCGNVALESGQYLPAVPVNGIIRSLDVEDVRPENDTGELNQESIESLDDSCPVKNDPKSNGPANGVMSEPESSSASNGGEELVSTDAFNVESTLSKTSPECGANQHIISEVVSVEEGSEVDDGIAPKDKDRGIAADVDVDFVHVESDVKSESQEPEDIEGKQMDEASMSSQENSGQTVDNDGNQKDEEASTTLPEGTSEGQNAGIEEVKRQFYFLIRSPRYDDENLREQIKRAKLQVEERTKIRGAIHAKVQTQRAIVKEYADKVQASLTEERAARDLFKSKRQEFDSVQSVIIKVKNAESVEDIHAKIRSMEHMIEHETLPLKEEKQLIREIKQLKQQREQISSNMGKQNEVQQALDQKDQIEERSKFLRKELDLLREKLSKAEEATQTAKKKSNVENGKLNELLYQFRDADGIRQEAYAHFRSLKEQYSVKIELFNGFKNAAIEAQKLALSKDKEQLQRNCFDQVEKFMELWNRDDDFRKDYIRNNTRSTLWRLGTFDGRSLGPDEEPPVVPDFAVNSRATKQNLVPLTKIPEQEKQEVPEKVEKLDDKSGAKVVERENQTVKTTKKPAKPAISSGTSPVTNSDKDERKEKEREEEEDEPIRSKEEEELARKAEELRKEEEAARLKQQRNLEDKAKAKEAMERKKRITEKAQARAAIRAQKEAEQKEKEREKRARKKERKKANKIDPITEDEGGECAQTSSSEVDASTGAQPEPKKPPATMVKRPQKPQQFTKQSRARSVAVPPPLLRSRGKKRMQTWMWVVLAFAIVLALLFFWSTSIHWFGF